MLRTPWPLFPCKVLGLHYFDISCRHRLHKYKHIIFLHIQEKLSFLLREHATEESSFCRGKKKKQDGGGCSASSQMALATIRFQCEKLGQLVQRETGGGDAEPLGTE